MKTSGFMCNSINSFVRKKILQQIRKERPSSNVANINIINNAVTKIDIADLMFSVVRQWKCGDRDVCADILDFIANNVSLDYEVFGNEEIIECLLKMSYCSNDEKVREPAFKIIANVTGYAEEIACYYVKMGLYNMCADIFANVQDCANGDILGIYYVSKIIVICLSYSNKLYEAFKLSPIPCVFINILETQSEKKYEKKEKKVSPNEQKTMEAEIAIINTFSCLYGFCGNSEDVVTHRILLYYVKILGNGHDYLLPHILECLREMIASSPFARSDALNVSLLQFLNTYFLDITFEDQWGSILSTLFCALDYSRGSPELIACLHRFIDPKKICDAVRYLLRQIEKTKIENIVSGAYQVLAVLFEIDPSQFLSKISPDDFEMLLQILTVDESIFELKKSGINFLLHLACLPDQKLIDRIFTSYTPLIYQVLGSADPALSKYAISVLIYLAQRSPSPPDPQNPLLLFFRNEDFLNLMEQWKTSEDEEVSNISSILYLMLHQAEVIVF